MAQTNKIYKGMFILFRNEPHVVLDNVFSTQGRVSAFNKTRLKSLISGKVINQVFKASESVEEVEVTSKTMQFLYVDGEVAYFMDPGTYEQISVSLENIDGKDSYLHPDAKYVMMFYDENPIMVKLPPAITLEVIETSSAVKGNTSGNATKEAKLETGAMVQVPLFISQGDKVVVNTETKNYIEKA